MLLSFPLSREDHELHYALSCHNTYFFHGVFQPGGYLFVSLYDLPFTLFFEDSKGKVAALKCQRIKCQIFQRNLFRTKSSSIAIIDVSKGVRFAPRKLCNSDAQGFAAAHNSLKPSKRHRIRFFAGYLHLIPRPILQKWKGA